VPEGTAASIFIGNNDYLNADRSDPAGAAARVPQVLASIDEQVDRLVDAGVDDIVLYTLPDISVTPRGLALTPEQRAAADALVAANNLGLKGLAASYALEGIDVTVVDVNRLTDEVAADRETFGLEVLETPLYVPGPGGGLVATGVGAQVGEENVAFFDPIHPTAETHEIVAAFSEATLRADLTDLRGDLDDVVLGLFGDEFVFGGGGEDLVYAWSGSDTVFAGLGEDEIRGGRGDDFLAAGSGDDLVWGGLGDDLIAGNAGNDRLSGGQGDDVIIDSSGGSRVFGDQGDDLILFAADGTGTKEDVIDGGLGEDALRLSVSAETFASEAFQEEFAAFTAGFSSGSAPSFTFDSLDLTVRGVESVQVFVDGAATEAAAGAPAPTPTETVVAQLRDADLWGLV
jgi:Ca2+-binding RTX toxin-like protein